MSFNSMLTGGLIGASLFVSLATPAIAANPRADLSIADRAVSSTSARVRIFNENQAVGDSAFDVTVVVKPIKNAITELFPLSSDCNHSANGSFTCNLFRVDPQYAKFVDLGFALDANACKAVRNGQLKVATATVKSKTSDPNSGNNTTNVYVRISCPN